MGNRQYNCLKRHNQNNGYQISIIRISLRRKQSQNKLYETKQSEKHEQGNIISIFQLNGFEKVKQNGSSDNHTTIQTHIKYGIIS